MTEREILDRQEQGGQREFYLVRVGMFLRAYGHGAFALSRATGYRVVRQQRKRGVVDVCGFPSAQLELVRQRLQAAGAEVEQGDGDAWLFRGIDGTPDDSLVAEDRTGGQTPCATPRTVGLSPCAEPAAGSWLLEAVKGFNLSQSTPMDAMVFMNTLQQEIRRRESHAVQ